MKTKRLFSTLALGSLLAMGALVGVKFANGFAEAKADGTKTLYFDVSELPDGATADVPWWNDANAETHAYVHTGNIGYAEWPGIKMELVGESTTLYSAEINELAESVIFTRVNPSKTDEVWNRTSKDKGTSITLPADFETKNCFVITADGSNYDDGNYCGRWEKYPAPDPDVPAEDGYYIVGTKSNWKFDGATKMDAGTDGNKAQLLQYAAEANEEFKVRSYLDGVDTWYGNNYEVGDTAKVLNIYLNGSNEVYIEEYVEPDVPAEEGYYICGLDGWKYDKAIKMANTSTDGNVAYYMNLEADVDDEIRVRSYYTDRDPYDQWATVGNGEETFGEPSGDNFKFTKAGHYDVYAKYESEVLKFYVAEHVDSYKIEMTAVKFNGKVQSGTAQLNDQFAYAGSEFEGEQPALDGYVARGIYNDENCTDPYVKKEFDAAGHLYVKYTVVGAYMVGDAAFSGDEATAWTVDGATILPPAINDTENNLYEGTIVISGASKVKPVEVRPAVYNGEGELNYGDYSLGTTYDFATKVNNNINFFEDGTYAIYYNKSNQVWINKGADAFYTKFLTEVGAICNEQGNTNIPNLQSVWSAQEGAFNSLSKEEKDTIIAKTIDGGNVDGSDLEKVIAKYKYIVEKYGTEIVKDFIWGQDYSASSSVSNLEATFDSTVILVITITAAASLCGLALFLAIKKRKHQ